MRKYSSNSAAKGSDSASWISSRGAGSGAGSASGCPVSIRSASRRCASAAVAPPVICARTNLSCSTCCREYSRWPLTLRAGTTCTYLSSQVRNVATWMSSILATALMLYTGRSPAADAPDWLMTGFLSSMAGVTGH